MDKIRRKLRLGALCDTTIAAINAEFLKFTTRTVYFGPRSISQTRLFADIY